MPRLAIDKIFNLCSYKWASATAADETVLEHLLVQTMDLLPLGGTTVLGRRIQLTGSSSKSLPFFPKGFFCLALLPFLSSFWQGKSVGFT